MAKTRPLHRFTPFLDKPRGWRRDRFVSLRWKIRQDPNGRGVYTCHHMMHGGIYDGEIYQAPGDSHWHDFRFLSHRHAREGMVYSATVRTALMAALDELEDAAWNKEREVLTSEEYALAHPPIEWLPAGRGLFTMKDREEATFERFDGLTAWGLRARFLREALDHLPTIHPSCRLDRQYQSGVGAIFVVDSPRLTIDSLAALVEDFWARGEAPYQDAPVDFSVANPANHQALRTMVDETAQSWERMDRVSRGLKPAPEE